MTEFTHFDEQGASRMVDVGAKPITQRTARASALVRLKASTLESIRQHQVTKGNVLEVARLAGIMAAKKTSELIPLCHNVPLHAVAIDFDFPNDCSIRVVSEAKTSAHTGVEMEAMVAVAVCALTIYDMCKSADRAIEIGEIRLEEKSGGKSGPYRRQTESES